MSLTNQDDLKDMDPMERLEYDWEKVHDSVRLLQIHKKRLSQRKIKNIIDIEEAVKGRSLTPQEKLAIANMVRQEILDKLALLGDTKEVTITNP